MGQKVKILGKYSIDAIDYEVEKKRAESTMKDRIESLGTTLEELKRINSKKKRKRKMTSNFLMPLLLLKRSTQIL